MTIQSIVILLLSGACAFTDLRSGRIGNKLTYPAAIAGVTSSLFFESPGFGPSIFGLTATLLLYGLLYKFGAFGAGDVKLMAAIGAFKGFPFVLYASFYILFAACICGLFALAWKGRLLPAAKWIGGALLGMIVPGVNRPAMQGEMTTMPFAPAIFVGTAYAIYLEAVNGPFTIG
jgi:prepilin peptidase CpaA